LECLETAGRTKITADDFDGKKVGRFATQPKAGHAIIRAEQKTHDDRWKGVWFWLTPALSCGGSSKDAASERREQLAAVLRAAVRTNARLDGTPTF
jgi:hypothetical protein